MVISFVDSDGNSVELNPGDEFVSTNKLGGRYRYQYLGIMPDECGFDYYIRDLDNGSFSNVELEWFMQRRIEKKQNASA